MSRDVLRLKMLFPLSFSVMLMLYLKIKPGQVVALVAGILANPQHGPYDSGGNRGFCVA